MRVRNVVLVFAAAAVLMGQTADMGVMLQRAIRMENVEGNLNSAIDLYKKVVAGATDRAIAAKALLGLGECYEKQGNGEAQKAYERLVKEFGDQAEASHAAQARLAAMGKTREGVVAQLVTREFFVEHYKSGRTGRITPDGKLYVYVNPETGNLEVRDLASGALKQLTNDATGTERGSLHASYPIPSRDGKQVAYLWNLATDRRIDHPAEVRVINIDGTGMRTVPAKLNRTVPSAVLDWTPNGKGLVVWNAVPESLPGTAWLPQGAQYGFGFSIVDLKSGGARPAVRSYLWEDASLSPDGRWLVYSRQLKAQDPNSGIFAADTQTGQEKAIIASTGVNRDVMWVPGSDRIIFRSDRKGTNGIWMTRFQDGAAVGDPILLKADAGAYTPLGVSRDGSFFYGLSHESSDIYSVAVDPVTLRAQGAPAIAVSSYPGRNEQPTWSPSGEAFAYFSDREPGKGSRLVVQYVGGKETVAPNPILTFTFSPHWCSADVVAEGQWRLDARTGEVQPAPTLKLPPTPRQANSSPDCRYRYFSTIQSQTQLRRIYRVEIATGNEMDLLVDHGEWATEPLVSPDEHWLALYGRLEGSTKTTLMLLPTQGGRPMALDVDDMNPFGYSWAPDSKRLLFSRHVKGASGQVSESELFWVSVDGGAPQSMGIRKKGTSECFMGPCLSAPSLNSDGKRLLYSATETSNELWVLRNLPLR